MHAVVPLKRHAQVIAGQAPDGASVHPLEDGIDGVPFIQGNAEFGLETPTPRFVAESPPKLAPAGAVLLSVRAPVGALNIAPEPLGIGRGVAAIIPGPELNGRFLWWALHSLRGELAARATGSTYDAVDGEDIRTLPLPFPDLESQSRITEFLDRDCGRIAAIKSARVTQRAAIDSLRNSITREAVLDLRRVPLKRAAIVVDCKHRTAEYIEDGGLPIVSTREVIRGALVIDEQTRRVSESDFLDLRDGQRDPRKGDIIYSRNASVGVAAYLADDIDVSMGQDVVLITRRPRDCELLSYVLNWGIADQVERLSIGSTFSRINVSTIRELVVPDDTPDAEAGALNALRTEFTRLAALEAELDRSIRLLDEYRDALITEAVTGQLNIDAMSEARMSERAHTVIEGEALPA